MNNYLIFTPPRTGRNFLQMGFNYCTSFWIESNNSDSNLDLTQFDMVFSIARDPKDSVASLSAMIKDKPNVSLLQDIQSALNKYNDFMKKINDNDVYLYNYNDLINNTENIFYDIAKKINVKIKKQYDYQEMFNIMMDFEKNNVHGYKKTFTKEQKYQDVLRVIDKIDFNNAYKLYNQALNKTIKL